MLIVRQSTARTVTVGPVLDADGVAVTGLSVSAFKIAKNGAAPAALNGSATATHRHTGHYSLALTTSDTDTVGQAEVVLDSTTNACQQKELTVIEEPIYDALFAASATGLLPANVTQFGGSNGTFASGRPEVNTSHIAGSAVSTSTAQLGVNVVNAGGTAWATVVTNLVTAVWSAATRLLTAGTNIVLAKGTGVTGFADLDAAGVRTAVGLATANLDTQLSTVDTVADAIKVTTDKLDGMIENASGNRFTEKALEEAPAGGGGGGATPEDIAAAVWDEDLTGHTTPDSAGHTLGNVATGTPPSASAIADEVQMRTIAAVTTVGSVTGNVGGNVTGSIGSLASQAKADVNAEVDAALADYDPPTKAELDSAVSPLATASALATVDGIVDDILADTADMQPKLGAPAGASVSADIAAVKAQTAAIEADTQDLQTQVGTDGAGLTAIGDARLGHLDAAVSSRLAAGSYTAPPSAADVASAVQSSATSDPLPANVKEINDAAVTGDGTTLAPWGPA